MKLIVDRILRRAGGGVTLAGLTMTIGAVGPASYADDSYDGKVGPNSEVQRYNLALDFTPEQNPGGVWTYGAEATPRGPLLPFGVNGLVYGDDSAPIQYWQLIPNLEPTIYRNPAPTTITIAGIISLPSDMVMLYSGTDGAENEFGVARFTVPPGQGGHYEIRADALPVYDSPTQGDTDFSVYRNKSRLFREFLSGPQQAHFVRRVHLQPGDTVDFVVGRGTDLSGYASGLKVRATLDQADRRSADQP